MNKQELVDLVVQRTRRPRAAVEEIFDTALGEIEAAVARGEKVTLSGFGTFLLGRRKAGKGFNPHTKKEIDLPEVKRPTFRAGKGFKEKLNP